MKIRTPWDNDDAVDGVIIPPAHHASKFAADMADAARRLSDLPVQVKKPLVAGVTAFEYATVEYHFPHPKFGVEIGLPLSEADEAAIRADHAEVSR